MTPRKTVKVDDLKEAANRMLAAETLSIEADPAADKQMRLGVCGLMESVLFATDNYKGYKHLESEWDAEAWKLKDGYDETRRQYL